MASPTSTELETQLKNAVALLDNLYTAQTVPADVDTYEQSIESDYATEQTQGAAIFRAAVAASFSRARAVLEPILVAYAHHVAGVPERNAEAALDRIYRYFVDNYKTVKSRAGTWATPGAFTGTGTGVLKRLTVDENNYALEAQHADAKRVTIVADAQTGADAHEELAEIRGANAARDFLAVAGSGLVGSLRALCSNQSLLQNPTFSSYSFANGTPSAGSPVTGTAGDTLTGWTVNDFTACQLDVDTVAKSVQGDTTPTSLRFTGNNFVSQLLSTAPVRLNPDAPYLVELWVYRANSADGTLTVTWGGKSQAFTVSSLSNAAWNRVVIDVDQDLWPAAWNATAATIKVQWSGRSTGDLYLDEVGLFEGTPFDGSWYWLLGGATAFLLDDYVSFTDSISSDSKVQKWLAWTFGRYLPHETAATQVTASGGRTLTFADADPDTITASSGDFTSDGFAPGMTLTVAGTSSNNGTYTIATVTATVITLVSGDALAAEGPLSATATLDAAPSIDDPA